MGGDMSKHYTMAYWIERKGHDNPDRCDYSNDQEELQRMASQRRQCDGRVFGRIELYVRTGEAVADWRLVRVIKPQLTPRVRVEKLTPDAFLEEISGTDVVPERIA